MPHPSPARTAAPKTSAVGTKRVGLVIVRPNAFRTNMSCSASSRFHASDGASAAARAVQPFGPRHNGVTAEFARLGATVVADLHIENLSAEIAETSVYVKQSRSDITGFLADRGGPVASFDEIYERKAFHPENDLFHGIMGGPVDVAGDAEYLRLRLNQQHFRRKVLGLFADNALEVLVYPTVQVIPPTHTELAEGLYSALTF